MASEQPDKPVSPVQPVAAKPAPIPTPRPAAQTVPVRTIISTRVTAVAAPIQPKPTVVAAQPKPTVASASPAASASAAPAKPVAAPARAQANASDSVDVVHARATTEQSAHVQPRKEVLAAAEKEEAPVAKAETPKPAIPKPPAKPAPDFELPSAIYSPHLLESVVYDIQYYLDWYRQNQIRKRVGAHAKEEPNHSDETVLVIEAWLKGKAPTLESLEALLDHLKHLKLPEVHIVLAALPNRTQREALVKWFRNNSPAHLLISFVADRNLGGGVVIRTPNRVFDYTWKQELVASRDKLAGILKRV